MNILVKIYSKKGGQPAHAFLLISFFFVLFCDMQNISQACKCNKCTASYLFLVPHHSIFYFGSHLHFPSPGLGHLRLKSHSKRERQCEWQSNEERERTSEVYIPGREVCPDKWRRRGEEDCTHTLDWRHSFSSQEKHKHTFIYFLLTLLHSNLFQTYTYVSNKDSHFYMLFPLTPILQHKQTVFL